MLGMAVFPEIREFAGNFLKFRPYRQVFTLSHAAISMAYSVNSLRIGAGKKFEITDNRETKSPIRENFSANSEPCNGATRQVGAGCFELASYQARAHGDVVRLGVASGHRFAFGNLFDQTIRNRPGLKVYQPRRGIDRRHLLRDETNDWRTACALVSHSKP